jgi:hypothetical protein
MARQRNVDFGLFLVKSGLERILYRLSHSAHREAFILKGARLFELWTDQRYRPTRDADFLVSGDNSPHRFAQIFRELCTIETEPDGLRFDSGRVIAERINENADYKGVLVTFTAYLDRAKIPIQIDIGFGDTVQRRRSTRTTRHCLNRRHPGYAPIPGKPSAPKKVSSLRFVEVCAT